MTTKTKAWFRASRALTFACVSTLTAACAVSAETEPGAPAGSSEPSATSPGTKPSVEAVRRDVSGNACSPNACCLLATPPSNYPDDPVENGLTALGCTVPAAYSATGAASSDWLYVQCPLSLGLLVDIARYSGAPYFARFSTSACLLSTLRPGNLIVEFDPTCDSCIVSPVGPISPIVSD